jgi:hypothetical protein
LLQLLVDGAASGGRHKMKNCMIDEKTKTIIEEAMDSLRTQLMLLAELLECQGLLQVRASKNLDVMVK